MDPSGFSFQPGATDPSRLNLPGQTRGIESPQSIVRMLSLRLPKRAEQGQLAPQALLQASGGAGGGLDGVVKALMQSFGLLGQGGSLNTPGGLSQGGFDGAMGAAPAPLFPTPRIIPGGGTGTDALGDRSQPDAGGGELPQFGQDPSRVGPRGLF